MPKQTLRLSAFGELKACGNNCAPFYFFNSALGHLRIHISLVARFETADKTVSASRNASAMLSFLPHPLAPLSRGAGSFAAEGLNKKTINYQLLALRCGQRSLVGNGFIRSACRGLVGIHRSRYCNKCIGISVNAQLKNRLRQMRCYQIIAVRQT